LCIIDLARRIRANGMYRKNANCRSAGKNGSRIEDSKRPILNAKKKFGEFKSKTPQKKSGKRNRGLRSFMTKETPIVRNKRKKRVKAPIFEDEMVENAETLFL
jgi:hypothetical protein